MVRLLLPLLQELTLKLHLLKSSSLGTRMMITSRKPARCAENFDVVFIYLLFIDK